MECAQCLQRTVFPIQSAGMFNERWQLGQVERTTSVIGWVPFLGMAGQAGGLPTLRWHCISYLFRRSREFFGIWRAERRKPSGEVQILDGNSSPRSIRSTRKLPGLALHPAACAARLASSFSSIDFHVSSITVFAAAWISPGETIFKKPVRSTTSAS